jgi:hypothetical protein
MKKKTTVVQKTIDAHEPLTVRGDHYMGYQLPEPRPHAYVPARRFITDVMDSPPEDEDLCSSRYGKRIVEWWKDENLMEAQDNLIEFGSAVWDYHDPSTPVPKGIIIDDGRQFAVQRAPSKEDLAITAFVRFWLTGPKCKAKDGVLGSTTFSKYMRQFQAPERPMFMSSARNCSVQEGVVAKGLEIFMKWKEALATDRDLVFYRALPRKFIGRDGSFISAGGFYTAAMYISKDAGTPVKHDAKDAVVAMILVPKGTPVIKIIENRFVSRISEYLLPPGTLCPSGVELSRLFHGNPVPITPVVYVPGKRFRTSSYGKVEDVVPVPVEALVVKPRSSRKKEVVMPESVPASAPATTSASAPAPKARRSRKKDSASLEQTLESQMESLAIQPPTNEELPEKPKRKYVRKIKTVVSANSEASTSKVT